MSPVTPAQLKALSDNAWLHFFQMGHLASPEAHPLIPVRAEGARLYDQHGTSYIDGLAGLFCVNAGYGRLEIVQAMTEQLLALPFASPFTFATLPQIDLSAKLASISPLGPQTRTFFTSGGSDAVETALKLAKAAQRKRGRPEAHKLIARRVAYHGTSMGALSVNGNTGLRTGFGPLVPGARHVPLPKTAADASWIAEMIEFEGPETVAAVIMEPVQNSGGAIVPPPGYLQQVRAICDHYGVLLIADEVICGFGRVGAWFGSTAFGIAPDLMTCAKGITSGYAPLGAVMARAEIADLFLGDEADKFLHGVTFGGHPASCAAALANINILEREQLCERSAVVGELLLRELRAAVGDHPNVGEVRGKGLFVALELVRDKASNAPLEEPQLMGWLSDQFKQRGLICRADDRLDPVIQLAPPLNIPEEDLHQIVTIVADVIHALGRRTGTQPTMQALRTAVPVAA